MAIDPPLPAPLRPRPGSRLHTNRRRDPIPAHIPDCDHPLERGFEDKVAGDDAFAIPPHEPFSIPREGLSTPAGWNHSFLVFENSRPRGRTPSDELNLCLHRTHGAGADPAIDEAACPQPNYRPSVCHAERRDRDSHKPSPVFEVLETCSPHWSAQKALPR